MAKDVLHKLPLTQFYAVRTGAGAIVSFAAVVLLGDLPVLLSMSAPALLIVFGAGLLVPLLVNLLSFWSMRRMPLNVHAPLFRTYVVSVFILSLFFLKDEVWTPLSASAVIVTFIGVVAFTAAKKPDRHHKTPLKAIIVCLIGAFCFAVGKILWKKMGAVASPAIITFAGTMTCAVIFNIAYAVDRPETGPVKDQLIAIISGILVFVGGNMLVITALQHAPTAVVSAIHSTSALLIAALAFVFLGERWTRWQAMAALIIVAGLVMLFFR